MVNPSQSYFNKTNMKKLTNNIFKPTLLAIALLLGLVGCQEFSIDSQKEAPATIQIDALDEYTVLATSPSNIVFNISSNTPWTITCDQQWCKPSPLMSAASSLVAEITVVSEPNETNNDRTAKITIHSEESEETKVITITQVSKEKLVVIPFDEMVPTEGGDISFNIISNKPWEIIPSTQFLENIDKTSGQGNESGEKEKITITIPANAAARRSGEIKVKTLFEEFTFEINQDGVVIELEEPTESGTIDFNGTDTEQTVKIRSNKSWKVEIPEEFKQWIEAEKIGDDELKVSVKQSNRLTTRNGIVLLKTTDIIPGFEGVEFTVTQKPAFWFSASSENLVVDEATGNVKVLQKGNSIVSHFPFLTGQLSFEFESMNLSDGGRLVFNLWPNVGNTNFHVWLRSDRNSQFTCGGSGFAWEQKQFKLSNEEFNGIKKVDLFVEKDPANAGKLQIRLMINGEEMAVLTNKSNPYLEAPAQNPGQIINLGLFDAPAEDFFVVKSITHTPSTID